MTLKFDLSNESISELGKVIQETIKREMNSLTSKPEAGSSGEPILLNRKEASKLLGCSLTTLHYYQKEGRVPFHQVGRKILFDKNELLNHLKVKARL